MRIVLHCPFGIDEMTASLREAGADVVVAKSKDELRAAMPGADALATAASQYDEAVADTVKSAPKLKWIHFVTSGTDPLLRFAPPPAVAVTNSAAGWAPTVAEHAVALLLALQRRIVPMHQAKAARQWTQLKMRPMLVSLEATTVVLLGFGAIGQQIARLLKPFGTRIIAVARSERSHPDVERVVSVDRLDEVLGEADALVAALPGLRATLRLIDARRLALLRPHAVVVNVGRGETIDENVMADALRAGRLGGAALDVYEREPLPPESALWGLDNVILSPHVAGMGRSRLFERLAALCADNARRFNRGEPLTGLVDLKAQQ